MFNTLNSSILCATFGMILMYFICPLKFPTFHLEFPTAAAQNIWQIFYSLLDRNQFALFEVSFETIW